MMIEPFFDERTSTVTYVVYDSATGDAVVIDPVLDYEPAASKIWTESADKVIAYLREKNLKPH
ncbi:MAG: MBL fold metallo-hydrolase, partial [Pseudomonadota bacterium]